MVIKKKPRVVQATAILLVLLGSACATVQESSAGRKNDLLASHAKKYRRADSHLHFFDFLQQTQGVSALITAMDEAGVTDVMFSGMPLIKKWEAIEPLPPLYYLADDAPVYWYGMTDVLIAESFKRIPEKHKHRFHPFISGFNPTDRNSVEHIKRLFDLYPGVWKGIGEIMTRHDDLTALTYGETARADHIALDPIYDLAAEQDMPVVIHSNISSVWIREPIYLPELERALEKHPDTKFIWCHAGISRRIQIPNLTDILSRVLRTHKNLSIDLSWVLFEEYINRNQVIDKAWITLIEEFPTRFMIGSDKVGKFVDYASEVIKYNPLLDSLNEETAGLVAYGNFLSLLPKRKHLREQR